MLNWTPEYRRVLRNTKKIAVLLSGIWITRRKSFPAQNSKALISREVFTRRRLIDNWVEQWPGQPFLYWNFVFKGMAVLFQDPRQTVRHHNYFK